ncbi:MAG: nucleotidyltransferase domain-containing protein [Candidatus Omnitrophica bacterium]|nr:nucleotidyltransferase domain-containing protein [Candidatus Omnitrophota bacterium]
MLRMKHKTIDIFGATNSLKVLSCLAENPGKEFLNSEIQKASLTSRAGAYFALKELVRQKLVSEQRRGRLIFYSIIHDDYAIKQFKILKSVLALRPLVLKLKPSSRKIILYGSYSRGENDPSSDIDLFILSRDPEATKEAISSIKSKQKIQSVVKTAVELVSFKESEKVFMQEVERGIVLWEEK